MEFRRAPGVVTAAKSLHWIAFTMAFVDMALQFDPSTLADRIGSTEYLQELYQPDFIDQFLSCARDLGLNSLLDQELKQKDDLVAQHFTMTSPASMRLLQRIDPRYTFSPNA